MVDFEWLGSSKIGSSASNSLIDIPSGVGQRNIEFLKH